METTFSMSSCRTGCQTQDHASWGECARDANLSFSNETIARTIGGAEKELNAYRDARKQGIQPASTRMADITKAVRLSDKLGIGVKA
jgi:hypothetical protein